MGLWSVRNSSSPPLLPPHAFPVRQHGSSPQATIPSRRTCSSMSRSHAADHSGHIRVCQHGLLHRLQGNVCSCTWSRPFLSFVSDLGVCRAVSPTSSLLCSIVPFLKYLFPEAPLALLMGTAVSCSGSVAEPLIFSQRGPFCRPLTTLTLPSTTNLGRKKPPNKKPPPKKTHQNANPLNYPHPTKAHTRH